MEVPKLVLVSACAFTFASAFEGRAALAAPAPPTSIDLRDAAALLFGTQPPKIATLQDQLVVKSGEPLFAVQSPDGPVQVAVTGPTADASSTSFLPLGLDTFQASSPLSKVVLPVMLAFVKPLVRPLEVRIVSV